MDAAGTVTRGSLLVVGDRIAAVGAAAPAAVAALPRARADRVFDARGAFVLPGFVHGHVHLCQTLFRGLAEQADLLRWLRERIWPLEAAHTAASMAASVRLAAVELLAGGVTCVNDMGTVHHTDVLGHTLAESGLRATFGKALMDQGEGVPPGLRESHDDAIREALAIADGFHGSAGGRLRVSLAPRFILSCSEPLWRDVRDASAERGLLVHTHVAESPGENREVAAAVGTTAGRWFAEHGVLCERFVGAHGVWLDDAELAAFRGADAALVHCPGANLKLGSGFADVVAWKRAGVRCGLGADGPPCNNRLDTFHEMSVAAGLSRVKHPEAPLSARDVVALATCDGARALGLHDAIGSLEPGKQADVVVLDADGPHVAPNAAVDPYTAIVHAARAADVQLTLVAGRALYERGAWATLDPLRAVADARAEARGLVRRAELEGVA